MSHNTGMCCDGNGVSAKETDRRILGKWKCIVLIFQKHNTLIRDLVCQSIFCRSDLILRIITLVIIQIQSLSIHAGVVDHRVIGSHHGIYDCYPSKVC